MIISDRGSSSSIYPSTINFFLSALSIRVFMLKRICRSETCMVVETMFSMAYLYRFYGANEFADTMERAAFNALPASVSPDCECDSQITSYSACSLL